MTTSTEKFFGELYLRSTRPFLSEAATRLELEYLARELARAPEGPLLDAGCGHGRHLDAMLGRPVFGLDRDALSLDEAKARAPVVQGDFFKLPFRGGAFAAIYAWYSALFSFEDSAQVPLFGELWRCLAPGGLLLFQTGSGATLQAGKPEDFERRLPDGSHLKERCVFDRVTGRDEGIRTLTTPDGRVMAARFFIRYYSVDELTRLLEVSGFKVTFVHGGVEGGPLLPESRDLIVGARRG
jgi:SAM-dependent methyltransferase